MKAFLLGAILFVVGLCLCVSLALSQDIAMNMAVVGSGSGAGAACTLVDSQTSGVGDGDFKSYKYVGSQFITGAAGYTVTKIELQMKRILSPSGAITAYIYADSGSDAPTGSALATSTNTVESSGLDTNYAYTGFLFSGLALSASTKYWIVLGVAAAFDTTNYVRSALLGTGAGTANTKTGNTAPPASNWNTTSKYNIKTYSGGCT